jgi:SRSO17 transposase
MLDELLGWMAGRFGRVEPWRRVRVFVWGLLADLPRKNCWSIAEHAGETTSDGMQYLLSRAVWDTDGVRDDLREFVVEYLGGPHGVLVVDETGEGKKAVRQSASNVSTPVPPGGWRTLRWRVFGRCRVGRARDDRS